MFSACICTCEVCELKPTCYHGTLYHEGFLKQLEEIARRIESACAYDDASMLLTKILLPHSYLKAVALGAQYLYASTKAVYLQRRIFFFQVPSIIELDNTVDLRNFYSCYSVLSASLQPHGLQHVRLFCPSLSPGVAQIQVH